MIVDAVSPNNSILRPRRGGYKFFCRAKAKFFDGPELKFAPCARSSFLHFLGNEPYKSAKVQIFLAPNGQALKIRKSLGLSNSPRT